MDGAEDEGGFGGGEVMLVDFVGVVGEHEAVVGFGDYFLREGLCVRGRVEAEGEVRVWVVEEGEGGGAEAGDASRQGRMETVFLGVD